MDNKLIILFEKMKSQGFFWSYSKTLTPHEAGTDNLIETVLKYGEVEDIRVLFESCEYDQIFDIWTKRILFDRRFERLNYYLSKIFFDVDLNTVKSERAGYERRNKLERLASRNPKGAQHS